MEQPEKYQKQQGTFGRSVVRLGGCCSCYVLLKLPGLRTFRSENCTRPGQNRFEHVNYVCTEKKAEELRF